MVSANTNTSGKLINKLLSSGLTLRRRIKLPPQFQNMTLKFMLSLLTSLTPKVWSALILLLKIFFFSADKPLRKFHISRHLFCIISMLLFMFCRASTIAPWNSLAFPQLTLFSIFCLLGRLCIGVAHSVRFPSCGIFFQRWFSCSLGYHLSLWRSSSIVGHPLSFLFGTHFPVHELQLSLWFDK